MEIVIVLKAAKFQKASKTLQKRLKIFSSWKLNKLLKIDSVQSFDRDVIFFYTFKLFFNV